MKQTNFKKESAKGLIGEERFLQWAKNNLYDVEDVRDKKKYRENDIDFIVNDSYYEIKTDYKVLSTGNIVIELSLSRDGGPDKSWWNRSLAEWIVVVDGNSDKAYIINKYNLEVAMYENKERIKKILLRQKDGFSTTESIIALIPLSFLNEMECVTEVNM